MYKRQVQINKNSSGMGGSAKVSLRGIRSVSGDNQPLYVIDGVPMSNTCLLYTSGNRNESTYQDNVGSGEGSQETEEVTNDGSTDYTCLLYTSRCV